MRLYMLYKVCTIFACQQKTCSFVFAGYFNQSINQSFISRNNTR